MWSVSAGEEENEKSDVSLSEPKAKTKLVRVSSKRIKPKLKPPSAFERVFGKPNAVKDRYFTAGSKINDGNKRDIHAEASPFKYPKDLEEFAYNVMSRAWRDTRRRQESKLKYNARQSYKTRQKLDTLNRLWVKEPQMKSMKTILDLDAEFFSIAEGRPAPQKLSHKEYIRDVRQVLRTKIITGYREDDIMLIEENFIAEQRVLDAIKAEFQKYVNTFEEFLFTDHTNSMNLLRESETQARIAAEKYEIFRELSKQYGSLKSVVYNLEEKWRNCKMYQKFLYLVSPLEWRLKYDFYHIKRKDFDSSGSVELVEERSDASIFSRYKLGATGDVLSLDELIDQFLDDVDFQTEPQLDFTEATQLLKVFAFYEIQNLNSLLHSEELAIPLENVKEGMEKLNKKFDDDMDELQETISNLQGGIIWEEHRAVYLEDLAHELIAGEFKELISHQNVINLYVFVEDVYETRIGSNDANLNMCSMMKLIEMKYLEFLLTLDRLPSYLVYRAEMECYKEEAKIMKVAEEAAKKVVQVERLMKHLARLLEPPVYKTHRDLQWRSTPLDKLKPPPPPPKPLTTEETDYLTFFVDFCEHNDDPKDFGVRVHKSDKKHKTVEATKPHHE